MSTSLLTTRELRRRWKPRKEALLAASEDHATCIRLHRAFSWLDRCEKDADGDPDLSLIFLWIAFNALYGQWDVNHREPLPDRASWRSFLDRLIKIDASNHIAEMLMNERERVMAILDDEYLSGFFWEEPSDIRASKSKKAKFDARTWYLEEKWRMILDRLLERVYLLRCQLVHGAATHGGRLNRTSLRRCVQMMRRFMNAVCLVVIDHGSEEDWGRMCYPPLVSAGSEHG
jgi:hypothetical protein